MIEHLKLVILLIVYSVCLYSGVTHFFPQTNISSIRDVALKVDYTPCQILTSHECTSESCRSSKKSVIDECHDFIDKAYKEVREKCNGYEKQLISCQQHDRRFCKTQQQNYASCKGTILKPYIENTKQFDSKILL